MLDLSRRLLLHQILTEGIVIDRPKLLANGLNRHAIDNLVKSKQLERVTNGIYSKPGSKLSWQGVIYSLQSMYKDFTVGGLTAMELQGLAHYLPLSNKKVVHLFSKAQLPKWTAKVLPDVTFIRHNEKTLTGKKKENSKEDLLNRFVEQYTWKENSLPLTLSIPERAYLEILLEVPEIISFEHADQLMQGMTSLSPYKAQQLLELCDNIKVRRLFFWFAERHNYAWLKKIDREKINMGSGKRALVKGGRLDSKYQITVPENL